MDGTGAALSGRTYLTGWPDRDPVIPGAVPYGDVIVPYVMAASVAAALQQRRRIRPRCAHRRVHVRDLRAADVAAAILAAQRGRGPARCGNDDPALFRQGVYPAAGDDRWVAISLANAAGLGDACGSSLAAKTSPPGPRSKADHELVELLQTGRHCRGQSCRTSRTCWSTMRRCVPAARWFRCRMRVSEPLAICARR